jgi:CARDB
MAIAPLMASPMQQALAKVETAQGDRPSPNQGKLQKSLMGKGFTVAQTNGLDLVVSALSTPNTKVSWGQKIDITWTVTNRGNQSATGGWSDEVYISNDAVLDSSDQIILGRSLLLRPNSTQPLAAGASYTLTKTVDIPGRRYDKPFVLVVTDISKTRAETNENNNTRAI